MKVLFRSIVLVGLVAAVFTAGAIYWGHKQLAAPLNISGPSEILLVERGSSYFQLLTLMQDRGWLKNLLPARIYGRLSVQASNIKAGEYAIPAGTSLRGLLQILIKGEVVTYFVTLVEGRTFKEILHDLSTNNNLTQTLSGLSITEIMGKISTAEEHPEGRFFPDTYSFTKGESDVDILRRAYRRMETVLEQEWQQRSDRVAVSTPYEALILASIVEKETGVVAERSTIAGVFTRRLKKAMRLQTDPTVIYGLGDSYKGNITRKHLRMDHPYNTYRIPGLPPTPIAMPGRAAIHAVLHPKPGSSLYFVAKGDGSHQFSDTLAEHNRAVKRYQLSRKQNYRSSPP